MEQTTIAAEAAARQQEHILTKEAGDPDSTPIAKKLDAALTVAEMAELDLKVLLAERELMQRETGRLKMELGACMRSVMQLEQALGVERRANLELNAEVSTLKQHNDSLVAQITTAKIYLGDPLHKHLPPRDDDTVERVNLVTPGGKAITAIVRDHVGPEFYS